MIRETSKHSDPDSKNANQWLKIIKKNEGVGLTAENLLNFLDFFEFSKKCKNDECINDGHIPSKKSIEKGILQFDTTELYHNDKRLFKRTYTIKITKKGQNYFMPFVLKLIELRKVVNDIKTQK